MVVYCVYRISIMLNFILVIPVSSSMPQNGFNYDVTVPSHPEAGSYLVPGYNAWHTYIPPDSGYRTNYEMVRPMAGQLKVPVQASGAIPVTEPLAAELEEKYFGALEETTPTTEEFVEPTPRTTETISPALIAKYFRSTIDAANVKHEMPEIVSKPTKLDRLEAKLARIKAEILKIKDKKLPFGLESLLDGNDV